MNEERVQQIIEQYTADYKHNKPYILKAYREGGVHKVLQACASIMVHVISAYGFIYQEHKEPEIYQRIVDNIKFYNLK
jgi:hypothetical protein